MKKILSLILSVVLLFSIGTFSSYAYTTVQNQDSNVYDSELTYTVGTQSTISAYSTIAFNNAMTFISMTSLGRLKSNTGKKVVVAYCSGPSGYTRKFKIKTVYASNTSSVISSLSQTTLGAGINIDSTDSYVEKQASISSLVVCDCQIQATQTSTVGFISYPSVTVGY